MRHNVQHHCSYWYRDAMGHLGRIVQLSSRHRCTSSWNKHLFCLIVWPLQLTGSFLGFCLVPLSNRYGLACGISCSGYIFSWAIDWTGTLMTPIDAYWCIADPSAFNLYTAEHNCDWCWRTQSVCVRIDSARTHAELTGWEYLQPQRITPTFKRLIFIDSVSMNCCSCERRT